MKCSHGISNFLEEISRLSHSIVFPISLHWSLRNAFLSLLAILWNYAFKWVYLAFSTLLFTSLLFIAICKASSDSHFDFLHFFFLKKVEKTARPFRYDLNQISYDYTVEVRSRFKGLDLIDRVPDELWMHVRDTVQETGIKTIPKKKKCKKANWLSEQANKESKV